MSFQSINRLPARGMPTLHEHAKALTSRKAAVPSALLRTRSKLVVQAKYFGDEDPPPSRRPTRPNRGFDDSNEEDQWRGDRRPAQSWDGDFDAPSRMDKTARPRDGSQGAWDGGEKRSYPSDRGTGRGGGGGSSWSPSAPREGAASESGYRGRRGAANYGDDETQWSGEQPGAAQRQLEDRWSGEPGAAQRGGGNSWRRQDSMTYEQLQQRTMMNNTIKEAWNWRTLAAIVEEKGSMMDAENVSSIVFKLTSKMPSRQQQQQGQTGTVDFARPRDPEAAQEYDRLLSTLLGWMLVLMPTFLPKHVSMCLQSLSKLELWNLEVITALVQTCVKQMGNLQASDYGNIMFAFAKFNYSPGQEFFDSFLVGSQKKLQQMYPSDLAKMAAAMAKLGCVPTAAWAEAFWKASADKIYDDDFTDVTSGDFMMAVAYFAQAGVQPPQQWVDYVFGAYVETFEERAARMAELQKAYQQQLDKLLQQQMKQKDDVKPEPPPAKPQLQERPLPKVHIINKMLYTLSNLTCKPSPMWFNAIIDAWRRQFRYCSPTDLGNISLYLGRYLQIPVSTAVCTQLLKEMVMQASKLRGDDIAAVAYLLSASRYKGTDKEIDDMVYYLKPRLPECSLSGLELVYNALPALGSGYRLNETVTEAANRYNELSSQAQEQAQAQAQQGEGAPVQEEAAAIPA